jgi:hypothetical protein
LNNLYVGSCAKYTMRPFCKVCGVLPRSVAYHKYDRVYYRSMCTACQRRGKKQKAPVPRWQLDGYKKKPACDKCGFKARYPAQLFVFHIDGDLTNSGQRNLRTVCLNCSIDVKRSDVTWRRGDLEPDL